MPPSKKMWLGASLLLTGLLPEILAGQLLARSMDTPGPPTGRGARDGC